jgi:hypothetical protein
MTDRELLEAAAKAAGLMIHEARQAERDALIGPEKAGLCIARVSTWWNPLTDDGDALRLAVRLGIRIEPSQPGCSVMWPTLAGVRVETVLCSVIGADPYAATRRAIVRAAAEIGKGIAQSNSADLPEDNYYKSMAEAAEVDRARSKT